MTDLNTNTNNLQNPVTVASSVQDKQEGVENKSAKKTDHAELEKLNKALASDQKIKIGSGHVTPHISEDLKEIFLQNKDKILSDLPASFPVDGNVKFNKDGSIHYDINYTLPGIDKEEKFSGVFVKDPDSLPALLKSLGFESFDLDKGVKLKLNATATKTDNDLDLRAKFTYKGEEKTLDYKLPFSGMLSASSMLMSELRDSDKAKDNEQIKSETKATKNNSADEAESTFDSLYKMAGSFLNHSKMNWFLGIGDILSAATDIFKWFPSLESKLSKSLKNMLPWDKIKETIDVWSVRLTKVTIMARFMLAGIGALANNRIVEAFGRIIGIAALPFVSLRDITLATGLSTAFSQTDLGLEEKLGVKGKVYESMMSNAKEWFGTWANMTKEVFTHGFGAKRKIFPDFKWEQITDIPRRFMEDMFSGKELKGKPGEKEEGHTALFGAYFIGVGALIGVLFGRSARNNWNKLGGIIRNFGGILGDYTLFTHPDINMRKTGYFTAVASIVDMVQRFMPDWTINTINHLNLINNMIGLSYYSDRTDDKTEGKIAVYQELEAAKN